MSSKQLLEVDKRKVFEKMGKTDKEIRDYVGIIKTWFDQQPHLSETPSDRLIEYFLVTNKFSIEKTKSKLDMYYTVRTLIPEIFRNTKAELPHMQDIAKVTLHCPLPKLTAELFRVSITKISGNPSQFNANYFFAHQLNINEIRLQEDMNMGDVLIVDLEEMKMGHLIKITPIVIRKAVIILEDVFSNRMKALHLVNGPPIVDKLVAILKNVMKQKMIDRIHVHTTCMTLADHISKQILPKDYGGEELSIREMNDLWSIKLEEYKNRFNQLDSIKVDETFRPTPLKNHELLGFYGNFKKLDID